MKTNYLIVLEIGNLRNKLKQEKEEPSGNFRTKKYNTQTEKKNHWVGLLTDWR